MGGRQQIPGIAGVRLEAMALLLAFVPCLATARLSGSGSEENACQLSISAPLSGEVFQAAACPAGISGDKCSSRVVWVVVSGSSACIEGRTVTVKIDGETLPRAQLARTEYGSCITQRKAQRPSRTCNESKEEEEEDSFLGAGSSEARQWKRCQEQLSKRGWGQFIMRQLCASIPVNVSLGEHSISLASAGDVGVEDARASAGEPSISLHPGGNPGANR